MRTSLPNIWAIGDSVAMYHAAYERNMQVALATNAVKSGIVAASNINGNEAVKVDSIVGTNAIHVFGHKMASTGISEEAAKRQGIPVAVNYVEENDRPEWMEEYTTTKFKIVYEKDTLRLLGAQVASSHGESHTETIYYLALAIQKNLTLLDLAFTDVYFLPHFNKPFNFVLAAVMEALGLDYYKE
jgi:NADPH-dependent 2,4-dienoyl-CoA reductase/sulfur reductase-like enzyme